MGLDKEGQQQCPASPALPRSVLLLTRSTHSSCPSCPCPTLEKAAGSVQARRLLPAQRGSPGFWSGWIAVLPPFPRTASVRKHQRGLCSLRFLQHSTEQQQLGAELLNMHNLADHTVALSRPLIKRQLLPHPGEEAC